MADIKNPNLIIAKGFMFLAIGVLASTILLMQVPQVNVAVLLATAIWGFCRFYYFAFYVIEHYVDPQFRFAGLSSFVGYWWRSRRAQPKKEDRS